MKWKLFHKPKLIPSAEDTHMQQVEVLAQEFYVNILEEGDEPGFVSDEASVFDVSSSEPAYLQQQCLRYYGVELKLAELKQPFWRLLLHLEVHRRVDGKADPFASLRDDKGRGGHT